MLRFLVTSMLLAALGVAPPGAGAQTTGARFAPYIDVTLHDSPPLEAATALTGARVLNLGFVVARGSSCTPAWGGSVAMNDATFAGQIAKVRARGADVQVSFGGAGGTDLGKACSTADKLASAYLKAIRAVGAKRIDIDLEGSALENAAVRSRVAKALAKVKKQVSVLVTLTLPVEPGGGLVAESEAAVRSMKAAQVRLNLVNLMTMDYGDESAPPSKDTMAGYAIAAATKAEARLRALMPRPGGWWQSLGLTPMIGVNDVTTEVFTLDDARTLLAFAQSKQLGQLAMWSVDRDRACAQPTSEASPSCSGVAQDPFAFSAIFRAIDA